MFFSFIFLIAIFWLNCLMDDHHFSNITKLGVGRGGTMIGSYPRAFSSHKKIGSLYFVFALNNMNR
jgi:hypothetical protein